MIDESVSVSETMIFITNICIGYRNIGYFAYWCTSTDKERTSLMITSQTTFSFILGRKKGFGILTSKFLSQHHQVYRLAGQQHDMQLLNDSLRTATIFRSKKKKRFQFTR